MRYLFILLVILGVNGECIAQSSFKNLLNQVKIGSTLSEFRTILTDFQFDKAPLYNYGVDSESLGILVSLNNENLIFVWTKYQTDTINEIIVLHPDIVIDNKIKVGSTLKNYLDYYPQAKIELDAVNEEYEYAYLPEQDFIVEFTDRQNPIATYNDDFTANQVINLDRTIDRIRIIK